MSSTTPNIGMTKTTASETIGQNWAANNETGGNLDILDTKIGPVGNTSVQAQLDALNSKLDTFTSITPSVYSSRVNVVLSNCYKIGRWVVIYLQLHSNQAFNQNTALTGFPLPAAKFGIPININGAYAEIRTNAGDGMVISGVPNNTDFIVMGVYNTLQD